MSSLVSLVKWLDPSDWTPIPLRCVAAAEMLEGVADALPPVLTTIIWKYAEPVYTCSNDECAKPVTWTTLKSWNQHTVNGEWKVVYCCEACLAECMGVHRKNGLTRKHFGYEYCEACWWKATYYVEDNFFYPYPHFACTRPDVCEYSKP
jgi:hypothetical protein